ncbi:MAG: aconitate hydratase AcnA, partial [Chromatiales bacterium]|nr:aconitate hydratase AcnA [Chromatiales bacterium]
EYGATMGFMPVDRQTATYLLDTGRTPEHVELMTAYLRAQGMWRVHGGAEPVFSDCVDIDLGEVEPTMAGPFRPNQRTALGAVSMSFAKACAEREWAQRDSLGAVVEGTPVADGMVVLAAITSCTNTSNPAVMLGAGLLAKKALEKGLRAKPWVKRSLAPGSRVVADYLAAAGLDVPLNALGFHVVGFGCTTCMGNSGSIHPVLSDAAENDGLTAVAVLSGNRNFEGRVHPHCRAAYLASPPLVVAYALTGRIDIDLTEDPLGIGADGKPVFLRDIWPSQEDVRTLIETCVTPDLFTRCYAQGGTFERGTATWQALQGATGDQFEWDDASHYLVAPPYFLSDAVVSDAAQSIRGARALLVVGDMVTTDHISPVSIIDPSSCAGKYLCDAGVAPAELSSYAARRANHHVMVRGTFASTRLRNELCMDAPGGMTRHLPSGDVLSVYDAAQRYRAQATPLIVIAGDAYGTGSSRDWAAKGTKLLGVRAVIAEDIERIHRSNLVGMGVLPAQFPAGVTRYTLGLTGFETFDLKGFEGTPTPRGVLTLTIYRADGTVSEVELQSRLDTALEVEYFMAGGMLHFALSQARAA